MVTVTNVGDPLLTADGTVAAGTVVEFTPVAAVDLQPCEGWDTLTGEVIAMTTVTAVTDEHGELSVNLWPTTPLAPMVLYRVRSRSNLFRMFYASLPASPASTTLITLRASQIPLTAAELSALEIHAGNSAHLPLPVGADGSFVKVVDGAPAYVSVAPGLGDMTAAVYDTNEDGQVNAADTADAVPWSGITDKPLTFPPETHSHNYAAPLGIDDNYVTDAEKAALHGHTNKATLDKITESGNLPLWDGSTWPGGSGGTITGSTWTSGTGAPSGESGAVTDWYLNDTNGDVYEKTGATTWTLRDNLTGPAGQDGAKGDDGAQGPAGATGPNLVSTTTGTDITGILKGNGSTISAASAGDDYLAPAGSGANLTGITASQVGALPLTGGTLTGATVIHTTITTPNSSSSLVVKNNARTVHGPYVTIRKIGNSTNDIVGPFSSDYLGSITWQPELGNGTVLGVSSRIYAQATVFQDASHAGAKLIFQTAANASGAVDRLTIDNNGNVGIGTTTPAEKLSIVDTGNVSIGNDSAGTSATNTLVIKNGTAPAVRSTGNSVIRSDNTAAATVIYPPSSTVTAGATITTTAATFPGSVTAGGATDFVKLDTDYGVTLGGTATVWDDVYPSSVSLGTGVNAPTFSVYNNGNLRAYEFLGATGTKELNIGFQIPHDYKAGSDIVPHIHLYIPDDGTGGTIKFYCEYTWENIDSTGVITPTTISGTVTRAANAGVANNAILSFGTVTGTGKSISSIFMCRIYRTATDANDDFGLSCWLKSADIHVEKDRLGSRTATAP